MPRTADPVPAIPDQTPAITADKPPAPITPATVARYDARPYFEKALQFGIQAGLLSAQKLTEIAADAPKGMVQIARYFGNENLRPDLEKARARIVNLVSLNLEHASGGDLRQAAEALRDHSFLSRSKGGSDMLRALLTLPESSHFDTDADDEALHEALALRALADWSLKSLADYRAELARRTPIRHEKEAAVWLADVLGLEQAELEEAHTHAEAVIRTALLTFVLARADLPDWPTFESMIGALRKKFGTTSEPLATSAALPAVKAAAKPATKAVAQAVAKAAAKSSDPRRRASLFSDAVRAAVPADLPDEFRPAALRVAASLVLDAPRLLDASQRPRALFAKDSDDAMPPLFGRYFWIEDIASELDQHERAVSGAWDKALGGNSDDGSLLTLFLCIATGLKPRAMLTEKSAASLIRRIRKAGPGAGFDPGLAQRYICDHAPIQCQDDYRDLWAQFVDEAQTLLQSDAVFSLDDALALLRRECNVK